MADWLTQYNAALEARDVREQAHKPYIDAYTLLADRSNLPLRSTVPALATASPALATDQTSPEPDELASLRADLSVTQKARAALAASLKDVESQLTSLQAERQHNLAQITALSKARTETERKLKDREDELRGKARLVEQAQDEMVALALQLHVSEEKSEKLTRENKELVDRWMKRMEAEADKVNRDSRWA